MADVIIETSPTELKSPVWIMEVEMGPWVAIKMSSAKYPYMYSTKDKAINMIRICYPDLYREQRLGFNNRLRVREIEKPIDGEVCE